MEKMVMEFGFGIACLFFFLAFALTSSFLWGIPVGLAIMAFGALFWEE